MKLRTAGILASHNHSQYIREAVMSLSSQVDEIIVIDDGSVDGTFEILKEINDEKLQVFHHETAQGVSFTYNKAVSLTNAEILIFQGGDDRSLPGRVVAQLEALSDPEVKLSYSRPEVIDENGFSLSANAAPEFNISVEKEDILPRLFFSGNFICAPSVAMRKSDFIDCGGFPTESKYLQDYALWLELAQKGIFLRHEYPLVEYRKHSNNISRSRLSNSSARSMREAAEKDFIRTEFINKSISEAQEQLRIAAGIQFSVWDLASELERIMLLQLSCGDSGQVRNGLRTVFSMLRVEHGSEQLMRLGITDQIIEHLCVVADVEGTGAARKTLERMWSSNE